MDEDVELYPDADDTEEFSVVRPDVFVVCDPAKIESPTGHIKGAPDFILEVLSPSTASTDLMLKAYHYAKTGVKEYWILDPASRRLTICTIEHDGFYGKRDINARGKIKLATMELFIDFDEVFERFPD
jgi:Uma2 family endonuclease